MTVTRTLTRPSGVRTVPLLVEPDVGHYPEFAAYLADVFSLSENPLGAPGLLQVEGRVYELTFVGRSGQPFPAGVEVSALVDGLEPLDVELADQDLWAILEWLVRGVGEPWDVDEMKTASEIFGVATHKR